MKVISNLSGKIIALINIDEVLPQHGLNVPDFIPQVVIRYGFSIAPSLAEPAQKFRDNGAKFENGRVVTVAGPEHVIEDFTLWPDGLVVNGHTTDGAEAFLDDFLTWGKETFGFRATLPTVTRRLYLSQIVVEFNYSPAAKLLALQPVSAALNEALQKTYGHLPPTEIISMKFDYDHELAPLSFRAVAPFIIERRENHRFAADNVFFSQAPLASEDHVRLLEDVERLLA